MTNLAEQLRLFLSCEETELGLTYQMNRSDARMKLLAWIFAENNTRLWYQVIQQEVRFVGLFYQNLHQLRTPDNTESLKQAFENSGYEIKYPELPVVVIECTCCSCRTHFMAPLEMLF